MAKYNDAFPGKYLNAEDDSLAYGDLEVTISHVASEHFEAREDKPAQDKLVVYFKELKKGLVLNKTNFKIIADLTGQDDTDNWSGAKVILTLMDVQSFGDIVTAIRIKKPSPTKARLMERHGKNMAKAAELGIADLDQYRITGESTEEAIMEAGRKLKAAMDAKTEEDDLPF